MMRKAVVGLSLFLVAVPVLADKKALEDRMMHAASILQEIRGSLDEEAPGVLHDAYAVAIFPEFVNVSLVGGVKHGRGIVAKRLATGEWSKPAFARITSGSLGLQFGVSVSQLLIVFKDPKAVEAISGGQFSVGADAAYAAGTLGGSAGAATDNKLQNQIVAVARSKGLFAGVALESGVLRIEKDANVEFYNDAIGLDGRRLLNDTEVDTPAVAQHFQIVLDESVPPVAEDEIPVSAGSPEYGRPQFDSADRTVNLESSAQGGTGAQDTLGNGAAQANSSPAPASAAPSYAAPSSAAPSYAAPSSAAPSYAAPSSAAPASAGATGTASLNYAADVAPLPQESSAGIWVTPDGQELPAAYPPVNSQASGGSGMSGELAGRARDKLQGRARSALWDAAKDLASDALRNNREVKSAELAAKVGGNLVDAALSAPGPAGAPKPAGPAPKRLAPNPAKPLAADNWVDLQKPANAVASVNPPAPMQVAAAPANSFSPHGATTPNAPVQVAAGSRAAAATARAGNLVGPPAPSEWPKEWLQQQALSGVCEQGS